MKRCITPSGKLKDSLKVSTFVQSLHDSPASVKVWAEECTNSEVCKLFTLTGGTVTWGMLVIL